jgi:hypothetical protein
MKHRARKSSAELSVISIDVARKPIEPPAGLKPQEARIFRETVASCDPLQFRRSDIPMLVAFATTTHLAKVLQ